MKRRSIQKILSAFLTVFLLVSVALPASAESGTAVTDQILAAQTDTEDHQAQPASEAGQSEKENSSDKESYQVVVDDTFTGARFDGIGMCSAGASSRLLIDYPEPQRSQILDLLFLPKYGLSLQYFRGELGGGENSTSGSEPSHAITEEELTDPVARGYELWIMQEARKRNPDILLDTLAWSFPAWIKDPWTETGAQYMIAYMKLAEDLGIPLDYFTAGWNEQSWDRDFIVNILRPAMDAAGFEDVELIGPDIGAGGSWYVATDMLSDPELKDALTAVTSHYDWVESGTYRPSDSDIQASREQGIKLWATETHAYGADWDRAIYNARMQNNGYIRDHITFQALWYDMDAMLAGLPLAGQGGGISANQPWSGHYEIEPELWSVAHTTQFVQPGWQYLDAACGKFDDNWNSTYVTMMDMESKDWSLIATTDQKEVPLEIRMENGASRAMVSVWMTNRDEQFVKVAELEPDENGRIWYTMAPDSIYTFSTTTGQQKGGTENEIPEKASFPLPYTDDFEDGIEGQSPKYMTEQKGTFEVVKLSDGNKAVRQIVPEEGLTWQFGDTRQVHTVFGNIAWSGTSLQADVLLEGGQAGVSTGWQGRNDLGYTLMLGEDGSWTLHYNAEELAQGTIRAFDPGIWHTLRVTATGDTVKAYIDGEKVVSLIHDGNKSGMVSLVSTYDGNLFDNVSVQPGSGVVPLTVPNITAQATDDVDGTYPAQNAVDGNVDTIWHTRWDDSAALPQTITIDLQKSYALGRIDLVPRRDNLSGNITECTISVSEDGVSYEPAASGNWPVSGETKSLYLDDISARFVQIQVTAANGGAYASLADVIFFAPVDPALRQLDEVSVAFSGDISSSRLTAYAESFVPGWHPASNAVDGDPSTDWITNWNEQGTSEKAPPHHIDIDLGGMCRINRFTYLPPQTRAAGIVTRYNLYTSVDGINFTLLVEDGTFENNIELKTVEFAPTECTHVRFEATEGVQDFMAAAELGFEGDPVVGQTLEMVIAGRNSLGEALDLSAAQMELFSDAPDVAVIENGSVRIVGVGKAVITARVTLDGVTREGKTVLRVGTPVESVRIQAPDEKFAIEEKDGALQLTAKILPEDAADSRVSWEVDRPELAQIDQNGLLQAKADGTVLVTAVSVFDDSRRDTVAVEISGQAGPLDALEAAFAQLPDPEAIEASAQSTDRPNGLPEYALDGDPETGWMTAMDYLYRPEDPLPQSILLDMGAVRVLSGLRYLPPADEGHKGCITRYRIYTSVDGVHFQPVAEGQWEENSEEKTVEFTAVAARWLKLEALEGGQGFAGAAELCPLGDKPENTELIGVALRSESGLYLDPQKAKITFESKDPAVARVDENGWVTRVGAGGTQITITVSCQGVIRSLSLPVEGLPATGDKTELKKVIDEADVKNSELDRYVDDAQAKRKFADALAAAKEVYEKDGATQDEIDQAKNNLIDAMTGLRLRADKDNLNKWLEDLKSMDLSQYTEESAAVVRAVIAKAEALAAQDLDENNQDLINAVVAEMASVKAQLVPTPADPEDPENPNPGVGSGESSNPESSKPNGDASSQNEANSEGKEATDEVPTTGDTTPIAGLSLLAVAAAGTVLLMKKRKD